VCVCVVHTLRPCKHMDFVLCMRQPFCVMHWTEKGFPCAKVKTIPLCMNLETLPSRL